MEIREIASPRELAEANRVTMQTKYEAYGPIVSEEALRAEERKAPEDPIEERFARVNGWEKTVALIAADEGTVLGAGLFIWNPEETSPYVETDEGEIRMLHVHPDHWGDGIGTRLLEAGIGHLPESTERLVLKTFEENGIGLSFYESRGFDAVGTTDYEVGGEIYPGVVLAREL